MATRDESLTELCKWLAVEPSLLPDTLWLSGRQSSGKTYLIRKMESSFEKGNFIVIFKDCTTFSSFKDLVQDMYCEITDNETTKLSLAEIFDLLKERKKFLLILDHCDNLLGSLSGLIQCFFYLYAYISFKIYGKIKRFCLRKILIDC